MRRIGAMGYLIASLIMALASIFIEVDFQIFVGVTVACLTALGFTIPDQFNTIISALLKAGFNRIGVAKSFIHVDDDPEKKQRKDMDLLAFEQ